MNQKQIQKIRELIKRHFHTLIYKAIGLSHVAPKPFNDAYLIGKNRSDPEDILPLISYNEWKKQIPEIKDNDDNDNIALIDDSTTHYFEKLQNKTIDKVIAKLLDASKKKILTNLGSPESPESVDIEEIIRDLRDNLDGVNSDWRKIVVTELNKAYSQGIIKTIVKENEGKGLNEIAVYAIGPLDEGTCPWCKKFYHDGNSFKIYKLSELIENGSNIGRKQKDWKPVIPSENHPFCRHRIMELIEGWTLDENGQAQFVGQDHNELKKSLQGKTPTFTGWKLQDKYRFQGMDISIENKKGSYRSWGDPNGKHGKTLMKFDYGYIRNTLGNDKDHQDVYIGDNEDAKNVYVVHQYRPNTGKFDEDKSFLGFDSEDEAKAAYFAHIPKEWFGSIVSFEVEEFKKKVIGKEVSLIKSQGMRPGHKYIKRTGAPGKFKYWYKDDQGKLYTNDNAPSDHPDYDAAGGEGNKQHKQNQTLIAKPSKKASLVEKLVQPTPKKIKVKQPKDTYTPRNIPKEVRDALQYWTEDGYTDIRNFQRGLKTQNVSSEEIKSILGIIDQHFNKLPKYENRSIIRALDLPGSKVDEFVKNLHIGQEYKMEAYSSFSKGNKPNPNFTDSNVRLIVKNNKSGRDISQFNTMDEDEVLVSKDTRYNIETHIVKQGIHYFYLREI